MYQLSNSLFETDPVLALECSIKDFEISMREAEYMLEMVDYRNQLNCQRAELKVMMEHGGYEDLGYLYEAADEDKKKSEGGILSAIWNKIKGFFSDIAKAFKNIVSKGDDKKEYKFPQGFEEAMNAAVDAAQKTGNVITSAAGKVGPAVWAAIAAAVAAIALAVKKWGGIAWKNIKEVIPKKKVEAAQEKLNDLGNQVANSSEPDPESADAEDPSGKEKKKFGAKFKELINAFTSKVGPIIKKIGQTVQSVFTGKKIENDEETGNGETEEETEETPETHDEDNPSDSGGEETDTPASGSGTEDKPKPEEVKKESAFTEATENLTNLFALIDAL